eukprot:763379-Hanusia_phi.AAC.4
MHGGEERGWRSSALLIAGACLAVMALTYSMVRPHAACQQSSKGFSSADSLLQTFQYPTAVAQASLAQASSYPVQGRPILAQPVMAQVRCNALVLYIRC